MKYLAISAWLKIIFLANSSKHAMADKIKNKSITLSNNRVKLLDERYQWRSLCCVRAKNVRKFLND